MYHSWLDRWDERKARRGDELKKSTGYTLDAERAFPGAKESATLEDFCALADKAVADPTFFDEPNGSETVIRGNDGWIKFQSSVSTGVAGNDLVWAKETQGGSFDRALVVFHHWNASSRSRQIASFFSRRGITVVEIAMPYHLERSRPSSLYADFMLSSNLGRTVQSMRQAVLDGRKLINFLKGEGYEEISVLGMSLGSWVACLVAAHDPFVRKAALFLTAGSLADMVWTGRATRHIRAGLELEIDLADLRRAWAPLDLRNFTDRLARPSLDLQLVLARRDTVVLPELSRDFAARLGKAGASQGVLELNCGHYSLALPPHIIWAGLSVLRLLSRH